MKYYLTLSLIALSTLFNLSQASAQKTDTIRPGNHQLQTRYLTTGLKQYLVYFQDSKAPKTMRYSLWLRNVAKINRGGQALYAITQHWYAQDTAAYRYIYSLNRQADFAPVYHTETIGSKTKAYNWYADHMVSADTVAGNLQKNFSLKFNEPNFNRNLDIETYEMLPLAAGKTFAISFYDAGLTPPQYEVLKVTGSEVLTTLDNRKVDCWILATKSEHNNVVYTQTYWISKLGHEMLKEEDSFGGRYRYKVNLPGLAPDVLQHFAPAQ
jgi:hypothetical protein